MLSDKFIRKYLRLAKQVGEDNNPCLSRHIGVVIVHPEHNRILSTGYNGPPKGTPHPDNKEYLREVVWPQLTNDEKIIAGIDLTVDSDKQLESYLNMYADCHKCPRKIIGAASGQRLELCSCAHGETNALWNASQDVHDAWMICWCGIPCWDCSKGIINAGIKRVICVKGENESADYSLKSRWLLLNGGVSIQIRDRETLDVIENTRPAVLPTPILANE